jgi:hypothetical protein
MKLSLIVPILLVIGCAATRNDDVAASSDDFRALTADEILGEIGYGETQDVDVTPTPRYRAFAFQGRKNDQILAQVTSLDATDPVLWVLDSDFNVVASNDNASATTMNANVTGKFLPKDGKYYLAFREMSRAPHAKFTAVVRKIGAMPPECDPDDEGFVNPDCTDPPDMDPFNPASCAGESLADPAAASLFGAEGGLRLSGSKIYYRVRQCTDHAGQIDCTPWVRAFGMDARLTNITKASETAAPGAAFTIAGETTRKVSVDFALDGTKRYCVDGPFTNVRGTDWTRLPDGTPGVCGGSATTSITGTCTRIEPAMIQLPSGDPTYYTEFSSVLFAKY